MLTMKMNDVQILEIGFNLHKTIKWKTNLSKVKIWKKRWNDFANSFF